MRAGDSQGIAARVVAVLRVFAEGEGVLSVKQVAERTRLPAATTHRMLEHLLSLGMVERAPQRRYRVGAEFFRIGSLVGQKLRIVQVARPVMREIVRLCNETCGLSLYLSGRRQLTLVAKVDPTEPLRYRMSMLERQSPVWGAVGRSIMAYLPPDEVDEILAEAPPCPFTGRPPPDAASFQLTLDEVRQKGYAVARGELLSNETIAVAAPFFAAGGQVLGNLCVVAPRSRVAAEVEPQIVSTVVYQAGRLSSLLGYHAPAPQQRVAS
ncbi:MAG TPA: IclR family transcriptional regulator [Candidatus Sulfotelmatobacter sp.]|nr:IclR family transcriptional regulator [Candidatus Sulfotelmatobacter sp.]